MPKKHTGKEWETSYTATLILEYLECKGPASRKELMAEIHRGTSTVNIMTWQMEGKVIYVKEYLRSTGVGGYHTKIYAIGNKENAPYPVPITDAENRRRWREKKYRQFGNLAWRMIKSRNAGGADRLIVDGKTVFQRGVKA